MRSKKKSKQAAKKPEPAKPVRPLRPVDPEAPGPAVCIFNLKSQQLRAIGVELVAGDAGFVIQTKGGTIVVSTTRGLMIAADAFLKGIAHAAVLRAQAEASKPEENEACPRDRTSKVVKGPGAKS